MEDIGLSVSRGDDRVEPRQILEKINDAIARSRFIVAKVDVNNLNVYYELGLAMESDKDVLLVSEHDISLPSDLTNWECLTYSRGDYATLRQSIAKFFKDNFHYEPVRIRTRPARSGGKAPARRS